MGLKLNAASIKKDAQKWEAAGVKLPQFDWDAMVATTHKHPIWVHFGAGNLFRCFIASLQQKLLNQGLATCGIIAADAFDYDIIDKIYVPHDNMALSVTLNPDGTTNMEIVASIAEGLRANSDEIDQMTRLRDIFVNPELQMVSFTITEKGYALTNMAGEGMPVVLADMEEGPDKPQHTMSIVTALIYQRYRANQAPLALCSMDNCSHNGEKLQNGVYTIAKAWQKRGFVDAGFLDYISDENQISFPWSMIDKITPRPHEIVGERLKQAGISNMEPLITSKKTFIAPFVNAENSQYLVIEDKFPNGRPPLENSGVYFTNRATVTNTEKMKVTTCLNPLHTAMSVYGCMLGYTKISDEMKDADVVALIRRLGYIEGLPVVIDPKILSPKEFLDEVVERRLPNPFMPDTPQRIATDTSQKVGVRFGETIQSYLALGRDMSHLVSVPLALAGWLRYLLAVDDRGEAMLISEDPMKEELQAALAGIQPGKPQSYTGQLKTILQNRAIFGTDLVKAGLADKIEAMFVAQLAGPGSVRATLHQYLA